MIGQTVGHYHIEAEIGKGGMGVVYRAEDTRLKRTVALKFLPPELTRTEEARDRFIHEAQAASALDHPNICTIHEIDGTEDGQTYMVLAYYEGETLRETIARRPLKIEDAIDFITQTARALARAHEQGIIHRDVKPANIFITNEGQVKILDFGLAKLTGQTRLTTTGTTLGTVSYMAPEQARGEEADHRADIWAVGVVMYEMLTGQLPFKGEHEQAVIYSILNEEPEPITALRSGIPPELEWVVLKALRKNRAERYQHIDELPVDLAGIETGRGAVVRPSTAVSSTAGGAAPTTARRAVPIGLATGIAIAALALGAIAAWLFRPTQPTHSDPLTAQVYLGDQELKLGWGNSTLLSPDGRYLVYRATFPDADAGEDPYLFIRSSDGSWKHIDDSRDARDPAFSPDSRWVSFYTPYPTPVLKRYSVDSDQTTEIRELGLHSAAAWLDNSRLILSLDKATQPVIISASTGQLERTVTVHDTLTPPAIFYDWFSPLPDQDAVLLVRGTGDRTNYFQVAVLDLQSGDLNLLVDWASGPRYLPTGHLAFIRGGILEVADFDLRRRSIAGPSYPTGVTVFVDSDGASSYSVSEEGLLVHAPPPQTILGDTLTLVDREQGMAEEVLYVHPHRIRTPSFDPHGERIAFAGVRPGPTVAEAIFELYVYDLAQGQLFKRPTPGDARWVAWSSDGRHLIYAEYVQGEAGGLYAIPADGSGVPSQILPEYSVPISCSPTGVLAYYTTGPGTGRDIWTLDLRENTPKPYLVTADQEFAPQFSPDGRFIAYVSSRAGERALSVRRYPDTGGVWQIQVSGYYEGPPQPVWGPDGKELFFRKSGQLRVVPVTTDGEFTYGPPETLISDYNYMAISALPEYDIHPDGNRILIVRGAEPEPIRSIEVVVNWFEELKRLQPPN